MLIVSVFLLPVTALAQVSSVVEQAEAVQLETTTSFNGAEQAEPGQAEVPPPTSAEADQEETPAQPESSQSPWAEETPPGNPFTPDGTATVLDNATGDDGKEFFTFTTPEGNVFFLVIDRSRPTNNVYFLNAVTEADLMALAEASNDMPVAPPEPEPLPPPFPAPIEPDEAPDIPAEPEPPAGNNGTLIFITVAALAFGGVAYYLKTVRPKKQGVDFDEEDTEYGGYDEHEQKDSEDEDELDSDYDIDDIIREVQGREPIGAKPLEQDPAPTQDLSEGTGEASPDLPQVAEDTHQEESSRKKEPSHEEVVKRE